jgi:hypothetical protein
MDAHRSSIDRALATCRARLSATPDNQPLLIAESMLVTLRDYASAGTATGDQLDSLTLGVLAVREFEGDQELSDQIFEALKVKAALLGASRAT